MSTLPVALLAFVLVSGPAAAAADRPLAPPCDPSREPCCPLHGGSFTTEYRHWRACVPVVRGSEYAE